MPNQLVGHGEKRSRKQDQAIAALLECQTITQAAEKVGWPPQPPAFVP